MSNWARWLRVCGCPSGTSRLASPDARLACCLRWYKRRRLQQLFRYFQRPDRRTKRDSSTWLWHCYGLRDCVSTFLHTAHPLSFNLRSSRSTQTIFFCKAHATVTGDHWHAVDLATRVIYLRHLGKIIRKESFVIALCVLAPSRLCVKFISNQSLMSPYAPQKYRSFNLKHNQHFRAMNPPKPRSSKFELISFPWTLSIRK